MQIAVIVEGTEFQVAFSYVATGFSKTGWCHICHKPAGITVGLTVESIKRKGKMVLIRSRLGEDVVEELKKTMKLLGQLSCQECFRELTTQNEGVPTGQDYSLGKRRPV